MIQIRNIWIGLILLVAAIHGEYTIDLGHGSVPNVIFVQVNQAANQTHDECSSILISDLFPGASIWLHSDIIGSSFGGAQASSFVEPVVVTIYNPQSGQICEQQRRDLSGVADVSTDTPTIRVIETCYNCHEKDQRQAIRFRFGPENLGLASQTRGSLQTAATEQVWKDVIVHSIQRLRPLSDSLEVTLLVDGGEICISAQHDSFTIATSDSDLAERRHLDVSGPNENPRLPNFGTDTTETDSDVSKLPHFHLNESDSSSVAVTDVSSSFGAKMQLYDEAYSVPVETATRVEPIQGCSLVIDECCSDSDCTNSDNVCVGRTCIDEGFPRFTLSWIGDDDLDLYVVTPSGTTLSFRNLYDEETGGRVGESVSQNNAGYHVENTFFPLDGRAPSGKYEFYVRPLTTVGLEDEWTLTVVDEQGQVIEHQGKRFSPIYEYYRTGSSTFEPSPTSIPGATLTPNPTPTITPTLTPPPTTSNPSLIPPSTTLPTPTPEDIPISRPSLAPDVPSLTPVATSCDRLVDECCSDSDCLFAGEVCFNRNCIDDGNPRITLSWVGDDDLDLFVITPAGEELSFMNFFDPISGGRFGEEVDQFGTGYHVESVYFPLTGAPYGTYQFFVRPLTTVQNKDVWTLTVVDQGSTAMSESGVGESALFSYLRERPEPTPTTPTPRPVSYPRPDVPTAPDPPTPSEPTIPPDGLPTPGGPPQTDSECNPFFDQCCESTDCRTGRDVCEQRTCIRDGNPRFSLLWDGDDDLDLYVVTPDGVEISVDNTFDIFSGGRFEMDPATFQTGKHVENVYFPLLGTPIGDYAYGVRASSTTQGADSWILEVYDGGELVNSDGGTGASQEFQYSRNETIEGPQRPRPSPPRCSPISDECCLDMDCEGDSICVQRTCITDGSPRITLRWVGDDDLNLVVETPNGVVISEVNPNDATTGGRHEQDPNPEGFGFHVESVYFPADTAESGTYKYTIVSVTTVGVGADVWRVSIYEDGTEIVEQSGIGDSREFVYERLEGSPPQSAPTPTGGVVPTAPVPRPSTAPATAPITERPLPGQSPVSGPRECPHECCSDEDCGAPGELCVQRTCVVEGTPRFTLTWTGNDDLNLVVITPGGDTISYLNPVDEASGGIFSQDSGQPEFGFHVENIVFPTSGGPEGKYSYLVKSSAIRGDPDRWALRVYVNEELVVWQTGTGESRTFTYDFGDIVIVPTTVPVSSPAPISPLPFTFSPTELCESDSDCSRAGELCIQDRCIDDGNPRFTLTWSGNDDLDLFVETPDGAIISKSNPFDPGSGGIFGEPGDQSGFGRHVENIYFPLGPPGIYLYYVRSARPQGSDDTWRVTVSVNGGSEVVQSGSGDSEKFEFTFDSDGVPNSSPTTAPNDDSSCSLATNECCSDLNCIATNVCTQKTCIDEGNPRFTLTWTGDDDLDLVVQTPLNGFITFLQPFDEASGGRFGDGGDQFDFGEHVENIFFPQEGSPTGTYTYYVRSFLPVGDDDTWTVEVFVGGQAQSSISGSGNSGALTFDFDESISTLPPAQGPTPTLGPTPALPTTSSPSLTPECSVLQQECCTDSQCITSVETCVQTQCIDLGNPRFTLTWTGDDDLDLKVKTPLGATIAFITPLDELSGGVYGEEGTQFVFGPHVENVYFKEGPSGGAPPGVYTYMVDSFFQRNSNDRWTVTVYVDNQEVASETGFGDSAEFTYDFQGSGTGITGRAADIVECNPRTEKCCNDTDCITGKELCVQRTCIDRGNPRFTLTWTGDDDLDLSVVTPFGTTIAVASPSDALSGGIFGEEGNQLSFGHHVENVFFPLAGGPAGTYTFYVGSFEENGAPDKWAVTVFVDDVPVLNKTGSGASDFFVYEYNNGFTFPPAALGTARSSATNTTLAVPRQPSLECRREEEECCSDSDCSAPNTLCVQRICIDEGNPRFTLTWNGDDDYDLLVVPPIGNMISFDRPVDFESGGRFGEEGLQPFPGLHAENIFFPLEGGPLGTYKIRVQPLQIHDGADTWTVGVFVDGKEVDTFSGSGDSGLLTYEFKRGGVSPSLERNNIPPCSLRNDECCADKDCAAAEDKCLRRTCIPIRSNDTTVILTWIGDDDLDLKVFTPLGQEVSYLVPKDPGSGAYFKQTDAAYSGSSPFVAHTERVIFPNTTGDSAIGTYRYSVSGFNIVGSVDQWKVHVFMNGTEVQKHRGEGDSQEFTFNATTTW